MNKIDNIVFGSMNIQSPFTSNPYHTERFYTKLLETYISYVGENAIIDTAYYYGNTTCEQMLGYILPNLSVPCKIATKVNPWFQNDFTINKFGQLSKENLEKQFYTSLKNLKLNKVDILYLHCPDPETKMEETLEICSTLHRQEKYKYLGLSNYSVQQLLEILEICEQNGYLIPQYYQGMYNLIARKVEEIFPIVNKQGMEFWAYNPLAGGILTGKYKDIILEELPIGRFKNNTTYQNIFWRQPILNHLNQYFFHFKKEKCIEYSFKWLQHYSKLNAKDKIILGASSISQLKENMEIIKKEINTNYPLSTIDYLNKVYEPIQEFSPNYFY